MKIRNGFVSNSSSSSFVVVGYKLSNTVDNRKRIIEVINKKGIEVGPDDDIEDVLCDALYNLEDGFVYYAGTDNGVEEGYAIVGIDLIGSSSDEGYLGYLGWRELNIDAIEKKVKKANIKSSEMKIFTGTRST